MRNFCRRNPLETRNFSLDANIYKKITDGRIKSSESLGKLRFLNNN